MIDSIHSLNDGQYYQVGMRIKLAMINLGLGFQIGKSLYNRQLIKYTAATSVWVFKREAASIITDCLNLCGS